MCGKHQCPIAQLVPPGFPSPGKFFAHPVTLLGLPGERNIRNIRNITCWLWGVVAQCGSQGAGGAGHSIARQHKELSALLFFGKKRQEKESSPSLGKESFGTSSREIFPAQRCRITKYPELEVSYGGHN